MRIHRAIFGQLFHTYRGTVLVSITTVKSIMRPNTLRWRYNERNSVSNHQPRECLLNRLFRRRSKKSSKLRVTGLCAGNSPGTGEFPAQMASNAENVSIWWRHHEAGTLWSEGRTKGDVCLHITLYHYRHYADLSEFIKHIQCLSGIFSRVCLRLSQSSWLSFMQCMGMCVFSLPFSLMVIFRICVLCLIIIIK